MLYAFHPGSRSLEPVTIPPRSGWVHAVFPTEDEQRVLHRDLRIPLEFLRHALDLNEVARVYRRPDGASLIMLREPHREREGLQYRAMPLAVVLLDGLLVTITPVQTEIIRDLLVTPDLAPDRHHRFLLQLVLCTAEQFLMQLRTIDRHVGQLEDELAASTRNSEVLALLEHQKSLVHLMSALASNRIMLERLRTDARFEISPEDRDLLEDALVEIHQAIEMATISESVLGQMMDAFASIISNNLNSVMKVLTAFTILLMIPTLIASFYGMNVALPGEASPLAFELTIAASLLASGAVALVLRRKHWI